MSNEDKMLAKLGNPPPPLKEVQGPAAVVQEQLKELMDEVIYLQRAVKELRGEVGVTKACAEIQAKNVIEHMNDVEDRVNSALSRWAAEND